MEQTASVVNLDYVTGSGNLILSLSKVNYDQTLTVGQGFTGSTYVEGGYFTINGSTFGNTLKLAHGVNFQLTGGSTVTIDENLVLEGASEVHQNTASNGTGAALTITGAVSGSNGIYHRKGGGILTFDGTVNLKSFEQATNATSVFNNASTLGSMNITQGTVKINNELTLNGGSRLGIGAGSKLQLGDGAVINRTNNVACWVQGNLEVLQNADTRFVSVDDVHVSYSNGSNRGVISLAAGSSLEMDVKGLYFYAGSSVQLGAGAELTLTKSKVVLSNQGSGTATLEASEVQAASGQQNSASNDKFELSKGHICSVSDQNITIANKLTGSSVENAGSGLLSVTNAANTLSGVVASGGGINLLNLADSVSLDILEVATGQSVGTYTGADDSSSKAVVTVSTSAVFGAGASLATAGLTLGDGVTLDMTDMGTGDTGIGVNLNGAALTFGNSLQLGEQLLADVLALGIGESLELFTGISEFTAPAGVSDAALAAEQVQASDYFTNLAENDGLYITYQKIGEVGTLMVVNMVPEPTTATLSLLALAGLAARRRRRQ